MRWIIGDVHGMLRPLTTLLEAVRRQDAAAQFIFVGDYVNRGPDSRAVIDLLLSLDNARFVRGNHDDIFDQILHGQSYAHNASRGDRLLAFQWFMHYGLDSTFISYGADVQFLRTLALNPTPERLDALVHWVPQRHRDFIHSLPPIVEFDDIFVAHGKWACDDLAEQPDIRTALELDPLLRHRLLWGRFTENELARVKAWRRTGYFGHTPVANYSLAYRQWPKNAKRGSGDPMLLPAAGSKIVMLDTACVLTPEGRLTAFCADTQDYLQANHFGDLVVFEQAA